MKRLFPSFGQNIQSQEQQEMEFIFSLTILAHTFAKYSSILLLQIIFFIYLFGKGEFRINQETWRLRKNIFKVKTNNQALL